VTSHPGFKSTRPAPETGLAVAEHAAGVAPVMRPETDNRHRDAKRCELGPSYEGRVFRRNEKGSGSGAIRFAALSRFRESREVLYSPRVMDTRVDTCSWQPDRRCHAEQAPGSGSRTRPEAPRLRLPGTTQVPAVRRCSHRRSGVGRAGRLSG